MVPALEARASLRLAHGHRHSLRESVEFAQVLAMDSAQVEDLVETALATNPALVRSERQSCVGCGAPTTRGLCRSCRPAGFTGDLATPEPSLREQLLADLLLGCRAGERSIAHHLVAALDRSGFLTETADQIAGHLHVSPQQVERVRRRLVDLGPPGIAAADARERLLELVRRSPEPPPEGLQHLLEDHFPALLGDEDGMDAGLLAATTDWVRRHLDPWLDLDDPRPGEAGRPADLIVEEHGDRLAVRLWGLATAGVRVDDEFVAAARAGVMTPEELERTREQITQATRLTARLEGRAHTVLRVAELVVERQEPCLRYGAAAHVAMTRAELARRLDLHESTVGRAVSGTTIQLPDRSVRQLSSFFGGRQAALAVLAELLTSHPCACDRELAEHLAGSGFRVARRTVAKYRHELGAAKHGSLRTVGTRT